MSYKNSIGLNRIKSHDRVDHLNDNIVKVMSEDRLVNYIYISNLGSFTINNNNQYEYPDGAFLFKLGYAITPKYFKLEYISIPNTYYVISNTRKEGPPVPESIYLRQSAPLKMVWRETNDGGVTVQTYNYDVPVGNYTIGEILIALTTIMNSGPNNTYSLAYNDITFKLEINRLTGTYDYALWFPTFDLNQSYYNNNVEQFISEYIGYSVIPLADPFTNGANQLKISPLIMDMSMDSIILLEIEGTPAIIQNSDLLSNSQNSFNSTFIINQYGNKGDYSNFLINKDFNNTVYFANKTTFSSMSIKLRDFQTGRVVHFNGASPYMVFSYVEYGLHENFNN